MAFWEEFGGQIVGGLLGGFAGSQDGQDQVTSSQPYYLQGQEEGLVNFLNEAKNQYMAGPQQYYPGSTVAPLDPNVTAGQNAALGVTDAQQAAAQNMLDASSRLLSGGNMVGGFQLPDQIGWGIDPGLANAVTDPIYRNLEERIMPSLDLAATGQGAFGGTRQALLKGQAAANANEQAMEALTRANLQARQQSIGQRAGDISAQIQGRGQDINQNIGMNNAIASGLHYGPTALQSSLAPANTMMDIGQQRTAYEQALLDADRARFEFNQQAPLTHLDLLGNRFNMIPSGTTTTLQGQDANWLDILGGVGTGVSIYNDIFKPTNTTNTTSTG